MQLKSKRIAEIIKGFEGKKVLILGDIMIDEYLRGRVTRLSPEAPVPVVEIEHETILFGGAANVALNIKELGCTPLLVGLIGKDKPAKSILELMQIEGIDSSYLIKSNNRPTTVKTRIIGDNQHISRVDKESREYASSSEEKEILLMIDSSLKNSEAVIFEDYNKGVLTKNIIKSTILKCKERGIPIFVDPKFENFMEYQQVTFFKPNIKEAQQAMAKSFDTDRNIEAFGLELLDRINAENLLLTRGAKGVSLFEKGRKITHIPTLARKVADVSGAGDTVIATLSAAYIGGASKIEAAALANKAAGIVVEEVGIIPINISKLLA